MQTVVKKWFRDKEYGFLDNGAGPDIIVRKVDLIKCQYLKIGAMVEFECFSEKNGLTAKKVRLAKQNNQTSQHNKNSRPLHIGVMT